MPIHDPQSPDPDWAQLARYFSGELTPSEARALERWFERDERSRQLLLEARAAWSASGSPHGEWDADAGVRRLRRAVAATSTAATSTVPLRRWQLPTAVRSGHRRLLPAALAATLAALAASGLGFWGYGRMNTAHHHAASVAMTEVTTRRGQRAEVRLPDGSEVVLGVASRLRYPRDFDVGTRAVDLEGEAYFKVVHDATKPFRVLTGRGELEDVGTEFAVRAYAEPVTRVVVAQGAVVVRRSAVPGDSALLAAAQLALLDDHGLTRYAGVRVDDYLAWMQDELVFNDAPLGDVAAELTRWYDADIGVADSAIARRRFTGSFRHQAIETVIKAIAAATDVAAQRTATGWRLQ